MDFLCFFESTVHGLATPSTLFYISLINSMYFIHVQVRCMENMFRKFPLQFRASFEWKYIFLFTEHVTFTPLYKLGLFVKVYSVVSYYQGNGFFYLSGRRVRSMYVFRLRFFCIERVFYKIAVRTRYRFLYLILLHTHTEHTGKEPNLTESHELIR